MDEVIIVGAGASGLAAAVCLADHGIPATVLEGRNRPGGRLWTVHDSSQQIPIELGAEFIHGDQNGVWDLVRRGGLQTHEVPDRHWRLSRAGLMEMGSFWDRLNEAFERLDPQRPDENVAAWLAGITDLHGRTRQMMLDFVEGFHAAPAERMGTRALALATQASEESGGERNFRIHSGYSELIGMLVARALSKNVRLHLNTVVTKIRWEPGWVEIEANTSAGRRVLSARRVVITLPLGVLQSEFGETMFEPALDKQQAIRELGMGSVVKVTLQFRSRFWPVPNFGFIHSDDEWLPTWWSDERGDLLTGWAGGPRAEWLTQEEDGSILAEAFRALSRIFRLDREMIADLLLDSWRHDWSADPFSRGAYSYTPVNGLELPRQLGESVANTIFFAGEATDPHGDQGTVQGALESGRRSAREILAGLGATSSGILAAKC